MKWLLDTLPPQTKYFSPKCTNIYLDQNQLQRTNKTKQTTFKLSEIAVDIKLRLMLACQPGKRVGMSGHSGNQ